MECFPQGNGKTSKLNTPNKRAIFVVIPSGIELSYSRLSQTVHMLL